MEIVGDTMLTYHTPATITLNEQLIPPGSEFIHIIKPPPIPCLYQQSWPHASPGAMKIEKAYLAPTFWHSVRNMIVRHHIEACKGLESIASRRRIEDILEGRRAEDPKPTTWKRVKLVFGQKNGHDRKHAEREAKMMSEQDVKAKADTPMNASGYDRACEFARKLEVARLCLCRDLELLEPKESNHDLLVML
jgi:hypothetical protein